MAVYAVGDVQGCYDPLRALLDEIRFDPAQDTLCFTGDLVNRGPQSLEVLRFVRALPSAVVVLGNHDLHLLAVASGQASPKRRDTLSALLDAPDRDELLGWLQCRPLLHHDADRNFVLVHAGLLPQWDLTTAQRLAKEAEHFIAHSGRNDLFKHMYGDTPDHWDESLAGWARTRVIINAFTRLRYCDIHGRMDLRPKMKPGGQPAGLVPWFQVPGRRSQALRVVFGHWSTLGLWNADGVIGLDSGCLWGERLTAVRLDGVPGFTSVKCREYLSAQ